jgi:hypothetical protein
LGAFNYDFKFKLYTDLIDILVRGVGGEPDAFNRIESTELSTGILGWHTFTWNAVATPRLTLAPGLAHNDYFYATHFRNVDPETGAVSNLITQQPEGYYWSVGPGVIGRYKLTDFLMLQGRVNYTFSYWKATEVDYSEKDPNDPHPNWLHWSLELQTKWGAYLEVEQCRLQNRGDHPDSALRTDIHLGMKLPLGTRLD